MTEREIIRKAVSKASERGYSGWRSYIPAFPPAMAKSRSKMEILFGTTLLLNKEKIIFDHNFAFCFWGKEPVCIECGCEMDNEGERNRSFQCSEYCENVENGESNWRFHLKQMVVLKYRLKYIEKFLVDAEKPNVKN